MSDESAEREEFERELFVVSNFQKRSDADSKPRAEDMHEVGRIARGITHDLNNIFQNILGPAELLASEAQSARASECLRQIISACKRGGDLIHRLLIFTGQDGPFLKTLHLQSIVDTVRHNFAHSVSEGLTFTTDIPEDIWPFTASGEHIARVLDELAFNAYEKQAGEGVISIKARNLRITDENHPEAPGPGEFICITVSDSSGGMDETTRQHAFEPFFTTKGRAQHSGLGLPLIHDIVTIHGGTIHCDTTPGEGTIFRIYLPARADVTADHRGTSGTQNTSAATILMVNDDPNICWATEIMLQEQGHEVYTAATGQEALELYRETGRCIDLVILDLVLPEMDGETCLGHLLQLDPDARVIIASGALNDPARRRRLNGKACGYLSKPFAYDSLLQAVNDALQDA